MRKARENLRLLDDLAKVATGAFGSMSEVRGLVRRLVKERVDSIMTELDMVSREDFDRVEGMARKARQRQEELEARIADLEEKLAGKKKAPAKTKTAKTAKPKTKTTRTKKRK